MSRDLVLCLACDLCGAWPLDRFTSLAALGRDSS